MQSNYNLDFDDEDDDDQELNVNINAQKPSTWNLQDIERVIFTQITPNSFLIRYKLFSLVERADE